MGDDECGIAQEDVEIKVLDKSAVAHGACVCGALAIGYNRTALEQKR